MIRLLALCAVICLDAVFAILSCFSLTMHVLRQALILPLYARLAVAEPAPAAALVDLRLAYPALS